MKERIKGAFTKRKILHFLKMALFVVALSLILLSLLGTVAHATGLVDDTINAENLYSKYPLSNYQLDFFVDKQRANAKGVPFHTTNETPFANPPRIQQTSYCAALLRLIASAGKSPMPVTGEISARQRNHRHGHANHVKQPIDGM